MSEDPRARFEAMAREVVEPVRRYLARRTDPDTAADVLAETLLVLWRRVEETPEDAVPWSIGVARTLALDPPRAAAPPLVADPAPESAAVAQAMATLRAEDAELLRLWAWEELDPAGIAAVLGITPNAAAIRLTRARGKLRTALQAQDAGIAAGRSRPRARNQPAADQHPDPDSGPDLDPEVDPDEDRSGGLDDWFPEPEDRPQYPDRY